MAGTIARGIRTPIIRQGDDIVKITADSVLQTAENEGFVLHDRDVIAVTEAVVARADGNYCTVDDIAQDVKNKLAPSVGVLFPILSRNRFSLCLKGIARGAKKVVVQLSFPSDEEGNTLMDEDALFDSGIHSDSAVLDTETFIRLFGQPCHLFTGVNYVEYYTQLIENEGAEAEIFFANDPIAMVGKAESIIVANIHQRERCKKRLLAAGAEKVVTLCDILNAPVNGSGYQPEYGLLGSNKATDEQLKLFPKNAQEIALGIQLEMYKRTGLHIEAMVYGDGAFKDPVGKIWELADPVSAVGFTEGLAGLPNEVKLKYLADNDFANLSGEALAEAIRESIRRKEADLKGQMASQGTTPRRLRDLLGSLCDLVSGSGDKGTPVVLVQNYFHNYADK